MLEQEKDDVIPDQGDPVDGTINLAKELFDKIEKATRGGYSRFKLKYSDGSSGYVDLLCKNKSEYESLGKYRLGFWLYYYPNHNNPIIPNNIFTHGIEEMLKYIFEVFPEIKSYPKEVMDEFRFYLANDTIYYKEGIMHLTTTYDLLPSTERNQLLGNYELWDLIHNTDVFIATYYLDNPPKFSEDYVLSMDRAIKKLNTVYAALRKGKFRGYEYEYSSRPTYVVHQRYNNYNKETRVIYPDFSLTVSTAWPKLNGKYINQYESEDLIIDFDTFMKKKFKQFGIDLT